jgi:hypothetical protein
MVMKALIGGIVGALLLGGVLLLFGGRTNAFPQTYALDLSSVDPMLVNCGEGRQALVRPVAAGQRISQVECVAAPAAIPQSYGLVPAVQTFAQPQPVVERVVYREPVVTRSAAPVSRTTVVRKDGRTWKKSALIVGGSAAGGAGLGAIMGGKSGAKKGAVIGGVGGLVYDLATRNR